MRRRTIKWATRRHQLLTTAAVVLLVAPACVPPAAPATDTFLIDGFERWSEPTYDVAAFVNRSCVSDAPFEAVQFTLEVRNHEGAVVERFGMRRGEYQGYQLDDLPLPTPGSYSFDSGVNGLFTGFELSDPPGILSSGRLDISEVELQRLNAVCPEDYEVTRLRATFWVSTYVGIVTGSASIG